MQLKDVFDGLIAGRQIRRTEWPEVFHVRLIDSKVMIRNEDKLYHPWFLSGEDLVADDWVI